jgi:hypothetical protein
MQPAHYTQGPVHCIDAMVSAFAAGCATARRQKPWRHNAIPGRRDNATHAGFVITRSAFSQNPQSAFSRNSDGYDVVVRVGVARKWEFTVGNKDVNGSGTRG